MHFKTAPATKTTAVEEGIVKAKIQKSSESQTGFAKVTDNHGKTTILIVTLFNCLTKLEYKK